MTVMDKTDFLVNMKHVQKIVIENLMIHEDFATYFDFLYLDGYKRVHENEYLENAVKNILIRRFIRSNKGLPLKIESVEKFDIIPNEWYAVDPLTINKQDKLKYIKKAYKDYMERMEYTEDNLQKIAMHFSSQGNSQAYHFVDDMRQHVSNDLKYIYRYVACLHVTDDIEYLMLKQQKMHDEKKEELKALLEPLENVKY